MSEFVKGGGGRDKGTLECYKSPWMIGQRQPPYPPPPTTIRKGSSAVVWNPRISIFDRKWVRDILDLVWLLHKPIEVL